MNRQADVQYCDDIRHEQGNKLSLMGCYTGDMIVSEFPAILPKLCLYIQIITPIDRPFKKLVIRIQKNDDVLVRADKFNLAEQKNLAPAEGLEVLSEKPKILIIGSIVELSPFTMDAPGVLRVVVETEEEELRARALRVYKGAA